MIEKAKRNQDKVEKQLEKLRKRELEQQQKEARKESAAEWSSSLEYLPRYRSTTPRSISRNRTPIGPTNEPWGTPTQ